MRFGSDISCGYVTQASTWITLRVQESAYALFRPSVVNEKSGQHGNGINGSELADYAVTIKLRNLCLSNDHELQAIVVLNISPN